jgi:phosphoglycolate phosphatase-like HAD superfamily hydrolase
MRNLKNKAILFDFDGTISTLRSGWETIMKNYMYEMITGSDKVSDILLVEEIDKFIINSAGIPTISQMQWLQDKVKSFDLVKPLDIWEYKKGYNDRLMESVNKKLEKIKNHKLSPSNFRILGSKEFLEKLHKLGYELFLASGTDHEDVIYESKILEVFPYFKKIRGASKDKISPKELMINHILENGYSEKNIVVIGDGKSEIEIGNRVNAITIGIASGAPNPNEINLEKQRKLLEVGADYIIPNFKDIPKILNIITL